MVKVQLANGAPTRVVKFDPLYRLTVTVWLDGVVPVGSTLINADIANIIVF